MTKLCILAAALTVIARDAGEPLYLTVRLSRPDTDVRRAAHSHQAIRRPAAPSRRQHP